MKWYKRDPDAALAGMAELSFEERGAYNSLIDLLYSRDGNVPDDDAILSRCFHCNPRTWRKLKKALIAAGKVRSIEGKLTANRVEYTLNEARTFAERQSNRARTRWEKTEKTNDNNAAMMRPRNAITTTTTTTTREESIEAAPLRFAAHPMEAKPRRRASSKVPFPEDWVPKNFEPIAHSAEFVRFRDSARAHDRRYADWEAAWRNWLSSPYRQRNGGNGSGGSLVETTKRFIAACGGGDDYVPGSARPEWMDRQKGAANLRLISEK